MRITLLLLFTTLPQRSLKTSIYTIISYSWTLDEIKAAIPAQFFVRDTARGLSYVVRDFIQVAIFWYLATYIDPFGKCARLRETLSPAGAETVRWGLWVVYWWFQGLTFTGIWVLGHEVCMSRITLFEVL